MFFQFYTHAVVLITYCYDQKVASEDNFANSQTQDTELSDPANVTLVQEQQD